MRARNGEAGFNDGLVLLTRQHEMFWAEAVTSRAGLAVPIILKIGRDIMRTWVR